MGCIHMTIQTAVLIETLVELGANVLVFVQHLLHTGPGCSRHRAQRSRVRVEG